MLQTIFRPRCRVMVRIIRIRIRVKVKVRVSVNRLDLGWGMENSACHVYLSIPDGK